MYAFILLPVVALFAMLVLHASYSLDDLRLHWNEYRCHPGYIPFANFVRPDTTVSDNFLHCVGVMGNEIFKPVLDVINSMFADIHSSLGELSGPLPLIRSLFARIRKFMLSFMATTFGKITNSASVLTTYLIKIRDILKRFAGQGYIASFLANVGIDFIVSFVMLCMSIIKTFVYALIAISIILALFQPELLAIAITLAAMIGASGF